MATYQMTLTASPFEKIAGGKKTIESRLYDEKRKHIAVGDTIDFVCKNEPTRRISTKVLALYRYQNFSELFSAFLPESFGGSSKDELIAEIGKFYSKEDEEKYGVVGIKIQLGK